MEPAEAQGLLVGETTAPSPGGDLPAPGDPVVDPGQEAMEPGAAAAPNHVDSPASIDDVTPDAGLDGGPSSTTPHNSTTALLLVGQSLQKILGTLRAMERLLDAISRRRLVLPPGGGGPRQTEAQIKWKAVGAVMDRFFMITYIIVIGISLTFLLPRAHAL